MTRGRPSKRARNITGLRNQHQPAVSHLPNEERPTRNPVPIRSRESRPHDDPEADLGIYFDSARLVIDDDDDGMVSEPDLEELQEFGEWDDEELQERMYMLAVEEGDDPSDENWVPPQLKKKRRRTGVYSCI
jgi:hypothetical protein